MSLASKRSIRAKASAAAPAKPPGGEAEGAFGRNVDGVGREVVEPPGDGAARVQRQTYFRIGRAGDGAEPVRCDGFDLVAVATQGFAEHREASLGA